ncbi:MAG: RNA polymerase sigma factor [Deltaproteobacteria bacterium]
MLERDEIATLVRRAQAGERSAFDALARAFSRSLYSVALAHLRRPSDAEDVAQEALLSALEHLDDCREPERFGAWIVRIARNRAENARRRRRLHDVPAHDAAEPASEHRGAERALERAELASALEVLTEVQREVLLLHDLDGWTHGEVAQACGITDVGSRQHLAQARKKLRERLHG